MLSPQEVKERIFEYLTRPTRKKGHRHKHAVHDRGARDLTKRYKRKAICNMRSVDPAFRRRQQDFLDAQRQVDVQIEMGVLPKVDDAQYKGLVQKVAGSLTEVRGGW